MRVVGGLLRALRLVLVLLIFLWTFLFVLENTEPVRLVLVPWTLAPKSISFWTIMAFVLGGVCGLLIGSVASLRIRRRELLTRRQLRVTRGELERTRAVHLEPVEPGEPPESLTGAGSSKINLS